MTSAPGAWRLAHAVGAVGAVGEAERVGCRTVGTEHLLLAAMADPAVRWAVRTVGVDVRDVRREVDEVTARRQDRVRSDGITRDAAAAVVQAGADSDVRDVDAPSGGDLARLRQELARRFLARTRHTDARAVLDRLGVLRCRARVLATIEHNARRAHLPSDSTSDHHRDGAPARPRHTPDPA